MTYEGNGLKPKLQVSKGFDLRFDQLSRLLDFGARWDTGPRIPRDVVTGGIGLSMGQAESVSSHGVGMGLIKLGTYRPTDFGWLVHAHDLFFDSLGTLWVCHYLLGSNRRYVIWNGMTNAVLPGALEPLTVQSATTAFQDLKERFSDKSVNEHVPKEIGSFFKAYTRQSFRHLHYLRETGDATYVLTESPAPVPPGAFLAILLVYRDRFHPGASGLEVDAICTADHSPGRLLHLDELRVRALLNQLHEGGQLAIEAKADLDQIRFHPGPTWLAAMQSYYEE